MITLDNPLGLADFIVWFAGSVAISYWIKNRYGWTVALVFGMTLFSALRIYQNSLNGVPGNPIIQQFDTAAESALVSFLLTVFIVQAFSVQSWIKIFKVLAVANSVAICVHFLFLVARDLFQHLPPSEIFHNEPWGILLNASMSGCFGATLFPLFDPKEKWLRILVFISVIVTGRSLPIAVLFAGIGASLFIEKRYGALALAVPAGFTLGLFIKGMHLFETRGRDLIWNQAFYFFRDHLHWWIGSGLGGFYVIGPAMSVKDQGAVFIWLHSDWLQTLFEQGIIGFVLVLAMYGEAVWRSRKTPRLFSALVAYGTFGIANMPLRYPVAGFLGVFLIRWAMDRAAGEDVIALPN